MKRPCNLTGDEAIGAFLAFLMVIAGPAFLVAIFTLGARP